MPQRIASLNLCTDQLLLMLVPRERIVSLTDWAARPESSYMAAAAVGIPVNYALAEGVLPQQPDLVIAGEYNDTAMLHLLRRLGYRVEVVQVPRDLAAARDFILRFGVLVGAAENARALVEKMDRELADLALQVRAIESHSLSTHKPLAAVYAPNGMTPGRHTVMTEILSRAGFRNLAAELGIDGYGQLALERLLVAQPDVLIYEATADAAGGGSIAHSYLQHPALQALSRRAPSVTLPPPLSECVGPMTVAAIARLVDTRRQWQKSSQHAAANNVDVTAP
ncbi:MAG: ABC transporter substrate-binding protein [Spongiibacteraceae bacterium]